MAPVDPAKDSPSVSVRKCLVSGVVHPKTELIRFVLDPSSHVIPDLAERLPGRGLWVSASRDALETAIKKNLFTRAAKTKALADPQLLEQVEKLLARRCLELLGLARGAGLVITGQAQVEQAVKEREIYVVLVAADAGRDGPKKLHHATLVSSGLTRNEQGEALGCGQAVYLGLRPHKLTDKVQTEFARWRGVSGEKSFSTDCEKP
ncbi:MAG: DUF448 domain-containing protein [Alphaproteobacteria bacterium]|nr:DUF448 domain-containing protein [Alphaproteobacteria bacterium]